MVDTGSDSCIPYTMVAGMDAIATLELPRLRDEAVFDSHAAHAAVSDCPPARTVSNMSLRRVSLTRA